MPIAIVIDPHHRTLQWDDVDGPEEAKEVIGCDELVVHQHSPGIELYVDAGGYTAEGQKFWRLGGMPMPFAGRGIIVAESPTTGLDMRRYQDAVTWLNVRYTGVKMIRTPEIADTPDGPGAVVIVVPMFEDLDAPPEPDPRHIRVWTIHKQPDRYLAELTESSDEGALSIMELDHPDLDELRAMLPKGLSRIPRHEDDPEYIIESWLEKSDG